MGNCDFVVIRRTALAPFPTALSAKLPARIDISWPSDGLDVRRQKLPMGSGRYWLGDHCLRQAVRMTTSPNLVAQMQTTFAERTMMNKGQRSALGHCIEGAPGRAS